MIQIEHSPIFRQQLLDSTFRKKVRQFTLHLVTVLQIDPHGRQLAAFICPGESHDNTEVVYDWVKQQCCCVSCVREVEFKALQRNFVRWLLDHDVPMGDIQ
jgi:hypothetical protein